MTLQSLGVANNSAKHLVSMSNAVVQNTSHGNNGLLFASWNQDQG